MTIHMIKLCVGVATLDELESYRSERAHWWGADYGEDVHVHRTRTMPKRRAEMEGQSSIYWVISGVIRCRQPILRLAEAVDEMRMIGEFQTFGMLARCAPPRGLGLCRLHVRHRNFNAM